jgi:hypothetical protein
MADDLFALADLVVINDRNLADLDVTDLLDDAPLLKVLPAVPASNGTLHKYVKKTGAPVVGFRAINDGREHDQSDKTLVTVTLGILDATFKVDIEIADSYKKGPAAFLAMEAMEHLRAAFFKAEKQLIYGDQAPGDTAGFTGMIDILDALADTMVVNAGGTTADTASSCWLIRGGRNDVALVTGNDGQIEIKETSIVPVAGSVTGTFPGYYTPISGYLGCQVGSAYSFARIANLTADAGKGLTDALIFSALKLFPAARQPNVIACSRRSLEQLRASRTATNATGAPAPRPTEVEGIPIIQTDAIVDTEALET